MDEHGRKTRCDVRVMLIFGLTNAMMIYFHSSLPPKAIDFWALISEQPFLAEVQANSASNNIFMEIGI